MTVQSTTDIFTNHLRYADLADWHREADALRAQSPVVLVDRTADGFRPFWAVIGHEEVMEVERQSELFTNEPNATLGREADIQKAQQAGAVVRSLVQMDAPDHPKYRKLTSDWFKPASLGRLQSRLDELTVQTMQKLEGLNGNCDFCQDIAVWYPLQVILAILGLPESDYARMLKLTQELFGASDEDLGRGSLGIDDLINVIMDFYTYFMTLTADRRANPTEDLSSLIANGQIDGAPMPDVETVSYYMIAATAGHDTTSAALTGGLQALVENPDQLALLQSDMSLISKAVDEMIRYVSPVRHFMRTVQADTTIGGQPVKKGDWVHLNYFAANRDPRVFEDPHRFDIQRPHSDRHLAFGFGAHFCLGSQLARMEMRTLFNTLIPRIEHIELAGKPTSMKTTFVGGPKNLPVSYRLRSAG